MTDDLPRLIRRLDLDRMRRYREALDLYAGNHWPAGSGRGRRRTLTANYIRTVIDKVTTYLLAGQAVVIEPADRSEAALARATEAALREVAEQNELDWLELETEVDTAVLGDGAYKVWWDAGTGQVRVSAPDVQGLYAWPDPASPFEPRRVVLRYLLPAADVRARLGVEAEREEVEVIEDRTAGYFQVWVDGRPQPAQPNPYGFIPVVVFPNIRRPKSFWGESDALVLKEVQLELNRAFTQLSRIMEVSGNPIAVLSGVTEAEDIAVQPGAVWTLPEDAKAYLLDLLANGAAQLHLEYINAVYRMLHDQAEVPRTAFGDNQRNLSGIALEVEMQPLYQRIRRKRLIRTAAYRRRNELILRLLEQFTGRRFLHRQRIIWGGVTPRDESRRVADLAVLVDRGLRSRRGVMDELGVEDAEAEFARWLEEQARLAQNQG